ncbi:MAG: protoporphyrinogen oxidase [Acidimicrobiales bacterium]
MPEPPRVAVVGGGITGLATAWYLRTGAGGLRPKVALFEAAPRLGGKIRTEELAGVAVEAGPDTFLARVPHATDLAHALGLGDELVAPATGAAYLWHRRRLHPLPAGTVLGVPVSARALLATALLSPAGKTRAALDLVLPASPFDPDPSVADVVGGRLGREVLDHLVEPLVGGIHAGRADALSLRSTAPQLCAATELNRSLIRGLRADHRGAPPAAGPVFYGVRGGMERLVDGLASSLNDVDRRAGTTISRLSPAVPGDGGHSRWRLHPTHGPAIEADAVVLTVPAFAAAALLHDVAPEASAELVAIRYSSVVTATLAYRPEALGRPLGGSGFLVPRAERRLVTACTFTSSKWPRADRSRPVLLRVSAGRFGDDRALGMDDHALVDRLHRELAEMLGLAHAPVASRVDRWPQGFPQYEPGHDARVGRIEGHLPPGLFLAGAAYHGLGIAACVAQAVAVAGQVLNQLRSQPVATRET